MLTKIFVLAAVALVGIVVATLNSHEGEGRVTQLVAEADQPQQKADQHPNVLVVAGGCFWCVEAVYDSLRGVEKVESGYTGGMTTNPTYEQICSGNTGHAEAVRITFDPAQISKADLLRIFFTTHDPTQLNRQGNDVGTQYRSAIFYNAEDEKALAESIITEVTKEKVYDRPIVTTLEKLGSFYVAENYHQDYFSRFEKASPEEQARMNAGYCKAVIEPKVKKFRQKYADKLKK